MSVYLEALEQDKYTKKLNCRVVPQRKVKSSDRNLKTSEEIVLPNGDLVHHNNRH
jgi:hypothetical protein